MNALITGATGLVGSQLLPLLENNDDFTKIISLQRGKAEFNTSKTKFLLANAEEWNNLVLPENIDVAFCCLGTTMKKAGSKAAFLKVDRDAVLSTALLAKKHGAKHFLFVSSMGASKNSMIFYSQVKGIVEDELIKLDFEKITLIRPSLLLGNRKEFRLGEKTGEVILKLLSPFLIGGLKKYRGTSALKVAEKMVWCSLNQNSKISIVESHEIL